MGASSRSPSPITTFPAIGTVSRTCRMASTAAWSARWRSPRPIVRAASMAAPSTARTKSSDSSPSMMPPGARLLKPSPKPYLHAVHPVDVALRNQRGVLANRPLQPDDVMTGNAGVEYVCDGEVRRQLLFHGDLVGGGRCGLVLAGVDSNAGDAKQPLDAAGDTAGDRCRK